MAQSSSADPRPTASPDEDGAGPAQLLEQLKRVAVALKEAGVRFALAGGYAAYARGGPHSDHDVDFVLLPDDVERAVTAVSSAGLEIREPPEDWLIKAYAGDNLVDLIFRLPEGPVDEPMLGRAEELSVESVLMPVLSATDLIASKLLSLDDHNIDLAPVLQLIRALREQVDWSLVTERVTRSPYAMATLDLVRRLGVADVEPRPAADRADDADDAVEEVSA